MSDRPSFTGKKPLKLREIPPPRSLERSLIVPNVNSYLRTYALGECSLIVTKELGRFHMSIAHPRRYPTWDEIAEARYRVIPEHVTMVMVLPPLREYVNTHENCFQLKEVPPDVVAEAETNPTAPGLG